MDQFLEKVKQLWAKKAEVEAMEEQVEQQKAILTALKQEVLKNLETLELEKLNVPGCGTVYRQKQFSVKVPKEPEAKAALFDWIKTNKGEDVLQNMLSINSMTLNSFYKSELEIAKEEGNIDFKIAGISEPEVYFQLAMRK